MADRLIGLVLGVILRLDPRRQRQTIICTLTGNSQPAGLDALADLGERICQSAVRITAEYMRLIRRKAEQVADSSVIVCGVQALVRLRGRQVAVLLVRKCLVGVVSHDQDCDTALAAADQAHSTLLKRNVDFRHCDCHYGVTPFCSSPSAPLRRRLRSRQSSSGT